jgi:hypothetical protein
MCFSPNQMEVAIIVIRKNVNDSQYACANTHKNQRHTSLPSPATDEELFGPIDFSRLDTTIYKLDKWAQVTAATLLPSTGWLAVLIVVGLIAALGPALRLCVH